MIDYKQIYKVTNTEKVSTLTTTAH